MTSIAFSDYTGIALNRLNDFLSKGNTRIPTCLEFRIIAEAVGLNTDELNKLQGTNEKITMESAKKKYLINRVKGLTDEKVEKISQIIDII